MSIVDYSSHISEVLASEGESAPMTARRTARLFVGEDDATDDPREVATWIGVYSELAQFCERALAEAGDNARPTLEEWREHFNGRLAHWRRRREELPKIS
jgi:hypothetical protein